MQAVNFSSPSTANSSSHSRHLQADINPFECPRTEVSLTGRQRPPLRGITVEHTASWLNSTTHNGRSIECEVRPVGGLQNPCAHRFRPPLHSLETVKAPACIGYTVVGLTRFRSWIRQSLGTKPFCTIKLISQDHEPG